MEYEDVTRLIKELRYQRQLFPAPGWRVLIGYVGRGKAAVDCRELPVLGWTNRPDDGHDPYIDWHFELVVWFEGDTLPLSQMGEYDDGYVQVVPPNVVFDKVHFERRALEHAGIIQAQHDRKNELGVAAHKLLKKGKTNSDVRAQLIASEVKKGFDIPDSWWPAIFDAAETVAA
jgi:hypothetical protein